MPLFLHVRIQEPPAHDHDNATLARSSRVYEMKLVSIKSLANAHGDGVWAVAWAAATGDRPAVLLTGSADESVKVWKGDELELERTNSGNSLGVVAVAASPDGRVAACTSLDSVVRIFDVDSNSTLATLESKPAEAWQMQFHPKGELLAVAGGGSGCVNIWKASSGSRETSLKAESVDKVGGGKFVLSVAWSPDGKLLACSSMDGTIAVFDVARGKMLHTLDGHSMPVRCLAFSPVEPRYLFTACDDKHVHMYDAEGRSLVSAMSGHASWVLSVAGSPDGAALASASSDRTVRLWDLKTRSCVQSLTEHKDQVWGVAFRPGRLATVADDRSICLYDYA
ncbi:WD repeat-containing protein VIP3 [Selaginella moellendorffii]|nr:WD repeat-containing protein VIP3 [Selaginella moellendorffii]|eukprot:XP_024521241.1 WD repeat-containing protein VIP3 [Selaginella moellendorffii]